MTYREEIQQLIRELWTIYDKSSRLRDIASPEEKEHWNRFRGRMHNAVSPLSDLDDGLSDNRATMVTN